ncbi:putative glucan 1,3-alpha-glucosidase [Smittium mucronatum]|uniref:Glucosidase II subunit alpha n=1 Tax=Smittium mucronatum TaxID=133383 RepID=A0A1R0H928_9FUNG|nr:putative glucan 1,3-alpha-glucosidase [Smittium mucronatum]
MKPNLFGVVRYSITFCIAFCFLVSSVKKEDFKTCNDSGFCKLHRAFADTASSKEGLKSHYSILPDSPEVSPEGLTATIISSQDDSKLQLKASFLKNGIVRVRIQELASEIPRYQGPGDYVLKNGEGGLEHSLYKDFKVEPSISQKGVRSHLITYNKNSAGNDLKLLLVEEPFSLVLSEKDDPIIKINSLGFFNFEVLKPKGNSSDGVEQVFEEKFNKWTDKRPRGPQSFGTDISFPGSSNLGEDGMYSEPYRLYNLDVFEHLDDSPMALYGSIPFLISHSTKGTAGVFWLSSSETWVDVTREKSAIPQIVNQIVGTTDKNSMNSHWISESGVMDFFLIPGPTPKDVFSQYSSLVGTTDKPREFAIGYHQCRWNYLDQKDVISVNEKFEQHKIPFDVIWLDIEHTNGKRYFTWDIAKYPDPTEMQNVLAQHGRKLVNVVDPHIKRDNDYYIFKQAEEKGYFIKGSDDKDFNGWCWPGDSSWIDYFNPKASDWISDQFSLENYKNSTPYLFVWNDMNEPAIFSGPEITMDKDIIHYGGVEHRDVHNIYGMLFHKATAEGLIRREKVAKRPFVLSRAYFAGSQRYGAIWTGDNASEWSHLSLSTSMILTNNLVGMHFSGADVGGFFGNPSPLMLTRWYQLGIWHPFFRAHAHIDSKRREPWLFGEPYVSTIREAIRLRYRLLPYWYTLFHEASVTGMPIVRPMWVEFPDFPSIYSMESQFMVGPALMVAPVTEDGEAPIQNISFPDQQSFYDLYEEFSIVGKTARDYPASLSDNPVFVVGGNIFPTRERHRRSSEAMKNDPYTINVFNSIKGGAKGSLYLDDGETYNYKKGGYIYRKFTFKNATLTSQEAERPVGSDNILYEAYRDSVKHIRIERVFVVGMMNSFSKAVITHNGEDREVEVTCTKKRKGRCTVRDPGVSVVDDWSIRLSF